MKGQGGFTLVELIVVVVIIGALLGVATLYFVQLNEKYKVESLTKEIYSTLMKNRNDAATTNTPRVIELAADRIRSGPDADGNRNIDDGEPVNEMQSSGFVFQFTGANRIAFDRRGLTTDNQTLIITGARFGATPAMDCISIAATRINIGKMEAGNCVHR
ncbi:MAG: prepilin-type N-terminal cleavage/methylation domain-containing protein [Desulfobulbus sp.]|nr:prepilin-type N-terminal cleavage/methylation domain-containing protein [Desulfobulbus sp.]